MYTVIFVNFVCRIFCFLYDLKHIITIKACLVDYFLHVLYSIKSYLEQLYAHMFHGFSQSITKYGQDNSIFYCCLRLVYIRHDEYRMYLMIHMNYCVTQDMLFILHEAWWHKTLYHVDKRFQENLNGNIYCHLIKS